MKKQFTSVAAALLATTAAAPNAWSQNATQLEEIQVTAKGENVAIGDYVIGSDQLEFTAPSKLTDVFKGETAVSTGGVIGTANKVYVHGLEEENLNVSIDGVRQGSGGWHHTGNALIDPELLKAVTVKPGVANADDGPGALAGVIAYETKDARDLLSPDQNLGGYGKLEWRSNGESFKEVASLYGRHSGMEFLLYGSLQNGENYEDGDGQEVRFTEPDMQAMLGKLAFNGGDGHRVETSFEFTEDDAERDLRQNFGLPVGFPPFAANASVPSKTTRSTFTLGYTDETPNEFITPSVLFSYNRTVFDTDQPDTPPFIFGGALNGTIDIHAETETYAGKINGDIDLPGGVLSVGVDYEHAESFGFAGSSLVVTATGLPHPTLTVNTPGLREQRRNLGGYAQARMQASEMINLSFGARADQQWFYGASGERFSDNGFSGNATVEVKPLDFLTLSAGYSHVWGGYTFGEAGLLGFAPAPGNAGVAPDYSNFEVTTSDNLRAGLEIAYEGFTIGASVFRTSVYDANEKSGTERGINSDLQSDGFDVKLGYSAPDSFITLSYTYTDVSDDEMEPATTNYYLTSPDGHSFAIQAGYRPLPELTLGGSAEIVLEYDDLNGRLFDAGGGNIQPYTTVPAYEVVNVFAEYEPPMLNGVTLRAEIENLLDETYHDRSSEGVAAPAISEPRNQPGRTFALTAKAKF